MKLFTSTHHAPVSGPPAGLMREVHLRRARTHVVEAYRDLVEHDPTLAALLLPISEALDVSIDMEAAAWR